MAPHELVIRGGRLIDGTGAPWRRADVAIEDGRVVTVGDVTEPGEVEIDASSSVVSPGFIDIHTHSDLTLPANREAHSKVRQGVTLEIVGNCGSSAAPRYGDTAAAVDDGFAYRGVADHVDATRWTSMAEYLSFLEADGISLNVGSLVGHENARIAAMGHADRDPSPDELEEMRAIVDEAMADGAVGLSTGLIYTPGAFAGTDEIVELSRVAASHDGIYSTHMRSEGPGLIEAVEEAIEIGRRASIPVQISHHKAFGRANWGKVRYTLRRMELARNDGVDVQVDQYPYIAASTKLQARLPGWARDGGEAAIMERLADTETRDRIATEVRANTDSWGDIMIASVQKSELRELQGNSIRELAARPDESRTPAELMLDLLEADELRTMYVHFAMDEDDVERVMAHPLTMIGSDGSSIRPDGPLGTGVPHPRSYGTFPRVLGRYVRERSVVSLETAVAKMTGRPAARLGLDGRGTLRAGAWADITVFDPETVAQGGTYADPHAYPDGIEHVLVNGEFVVREGKHTGGRPGVAIS